MPRVCKARFWWPNPPHIPTVGVGRNLEEARRIWIQDLGGIRVGILAMAQHEFSIATSDSPGANPLDLIDFIRNVAAQRQNFDYLIVILHAGNEGYPYPSPRLMETCRFLVEQGAGAVICHHSHCAGCWEEYGGGYIAYGTGNFIYDSPGRRACVERGFPRPLVSCGVRQAKDGTAPLRAVSQRSGRKATMRRKRLGLLEPHCAAICGDPRNGVRARLLESVL